MEHPRSKLPAVLVVLFCIALLAGVGVLLWKTLPEKQKPEQAETIQTDGVFSNEPTTVEPEREAPRAPERAACRAPRPEGLLGRSGSLPHLALFRSLRPEQPSVFVAVL